MISNQSSKAGPYVGDGVTTEFIPSPALRIFSPTDLVLVLLDIATGIESTLALTVDYTVSFIGASSVTGCKVTLTDPLPIGKTLTIRRVLPLTQLVDLRNQGIFFRDVHEDAWDYLTMLIQQLQEQISRLPDLGMVRNSVAVPPGANSVFVAFSVAPPNVAYHIVGLTTNWVTSAMWVSKSIDGFTVVFGAPPGGAGGILTWAIVRAE